MRDSVEGAGDSVTPVGRNVRPRGRARPFCVAAFAAFALTGCAQQQAARPSSDAASYAARQPDATVQMTQVQAAFIGSGGGGTGKLFFKGNVYPFTVAGLGIGGIGASTLEASGNVYNLRNVSQFPGTFVQGRIGFAAGTAGAGQMWLQNASGVVMELHAKRTGLMLSMGGDAVVITMNAR